MLQGVDDENSLMVLIHLAYSLYFFLCCGRYNSDRKNTLAHKIFGHQGYFTMDGIKGIGNGLIMAQALILKV